MILGCLLWMLSEAALDVYRHRLKAPSHSVWWKPLDVTVSNDAGISEAWMAYRQLYRAYHAASSGLISDIDPHVLKPWTGRNYDNEASLTPPLTVKVKE